MNFSRRTPNRGGSAAFSAAAFPREASSLTFLRRRASAFVTTPRCVGLLAVSGILAAGCNKPSGGSDGGPDPDPSTWPDPGVELLLSSAPDLSEPPELDESTPAGTSFPEPGMTCLWTRREYAHGAQTYPMLAPHADAVYPGADLQGMSLLGGVPAPITAPRAGGTIVISNTAGSPNSVAELDNVTLGTVTNAINSILQSQPATFPADLQISISRLRSVEEMQILIGASGSFFDLFSASAQFEFNESSLYSHFLVTLQQNFYSIAFERPPQIGAFYAPGVTADDLDPQVGPGNPAGYVSQVTYGRVFYLFIQATESEEVMEATLSANFLDLAEGEGEVGYVTEFDNVNIDAYAYGGEQDAVLASVTSGLSGLQEFMEDLRSANDLLAAKAVSYTVRSISSDVVFKNAISADYEYSDCTLAGECVPNLLYPHLGSTLDNGCQVDPNTVSWSFDWSDCDGSDRYQIQVYRTGTGVIIDDEVSASAYTYSGQGALPSTGWKWKVRSRNYGAWDSWSAERTFALEPANSDCVTGVRFYTHPNYGGGSIFISGDVPNLEEIDDWDDEIDSLKLYNLTGVKLYLDLYYTGGSYYFNHDCPDVESHSIHAGAYQRNETSSLDVTPLDH